MLGDTGAAFKVTVNNPLGSATSRTAALTVTAPVVPVLTITQQPANTAVAAGANAAFSVAATCSAGTLHAQWQRSSSGAAFADIAGATATTLTIAATVADNAATVRVRLDCDGQSSTLSGTATLAVTSPGTLSFTSIPITTVSPTANVGNAAGIIRNVDDSYTFYADYRIKRLSADLKTITTIAGSGANDVNDGAANVASFNNVRGIARDPGGNLYVTDLYTIRRVATDGTVTTIAGVPFAEGYANGTGSAARFNQVEGIAIGADGDLYVADVQNHVVRRVTPAGVVTTYAGSTRGDAEGAPLAAQFDFPRGVVTAPNGDVIVTDYGSSRVKRIVRSGNDAGAVETLAGNHTVAAPYPDGIGTAAVIVLPNGIVYENGTVIVQDGIGLLRRIDLTTKAVTTVAGSRTLLGGYADGSATTGRLTGYAYGIASAPGGSYIVTDGESIRSVSAAADVRTIATSRAYGISSEGTGDLSTLPLALYENSSVIGVQAFIVDPSGNLVFAEARNKDIRRISPTGAVTLIAGLAGSGGGPGFSMVDGVGSEAQFLNIGYGMARGPDGALYVTDSNSVRRIGIDNTVTTIAGPQVPTQVAPVDGPEASARFGFISSLAVDAANSVFVADPLSHAIRRIDATGNVTTYGGALGQAGTDDGPIATARFDVPNCIVVAPDGALLVADNGRLRRISPDGSAVTTLAAPTGIAGIGDFVVDADGTVYYGGQGHRSNLFFDNLYALAPGATTPTVLARFSQNGVKLGSAPDIAVSHIQAIALLGPKQLLVSSNSVLIRVTLP
ncbi:hypothetical protein BH10PSE17_BH10PSE17_02370 [soil metagenome]